MAIESHRLELYFILSDSKDSAITLTLFMMDLAGHGREVFLRGRSGGEKMPPLLKISYTYTTMMIPSTVIPYLKKIQKMYKSNKAPLEFS